ncbi:MAG: TolC family protein [Vicinamibacterales bacterium]
MTRAVAGVSTAWLLLGAVSHVAAQTPRGSQTPRPAPATSGTLGAPMRRIEFADAIAQALAKNPTIGQAAVAVARANALVQQARASTLPALSVGVTNTTLDSARGFAGGITQPQNQFGFSANARYELGNWIDVGHARDQVQVATASSAEAKQRVAVAAAEAYLAIISNRRQLEVSERALQVANAHLDYANKRLEGGAGSRLNQLRAAQASTAVELRRENTELALRRAQEALGVILAEDGPVDAGGEPAFDAPALADDSWRTSRPDLQTQAAVQRAAEHVVRDNWMDWMPLPVVSFDPVLVAPSGLFQPARTFRFTIQVVQPLFDGGQRRATLRLRQNAVEQSKLFIVETEIRAKSEVRVAQAALVSLERALATARAGVDQATEVLRITTVAFEAGATTNIEVLDAQRLARDAESDAAVAEDAVRRGKLDLLVAIGKF